METNSPITSGMLDKSLKIQYIKYAKYTNTSTIFYDGLIEQKINLFGR